MRNSTFVIIISAAALILMLLSPARAQPGSGSQNYDQNMYDTRFSPSMAIIVAVLIAALFFMGFFSVYIRHCTVAAQAGAGVAGAGNNAVGRSRRGARGLDASVISTFPTMEYSEVKGLKIGKGALECAVCICEFEDDETLRLIPKCDHVFHPECIDTWLGSHTTCPVCRADLVPGPVEQEAEPDLEAAAATAVQPVPEPEPEAEPSRSSRFGRLFPRSHSTGHPAAAAVRAGESTERFTLRLPAEVRKEMVNRQLNRASSMVVLPRGGSSRRAGFRAGGRLDRMAKSDRWVPFFSRMLSMKSQKVAAENIAAGEGSSNRLVGVGPDVPRSDSPRPPV